MRASRLNRASRPGSLANRPGRTLIATLRRSFGLRARYTSPMPPAPILLEDVGQKPAASPQTRTWVDGPVPKYTLSGLQLTDTARLMRKWLRMHPPTLSPPPVAVTDGSFTENLNKTGVRLWT